MSRIVVYGGDNFPLGEFRGIVSNLGWSIGIGGGSATVNLADDDVNGLIQFGRLVTIEHEKLPMWAGVIDTPWNAISPVQITMYNIEYLLNIRVFDTKPITLKSEEPSAAIEELINHASDRGLLFMQMGNKYNLGSAIRLLVDSRTYLEQIKQVADNYGLELTIRASQDSYRRLWVYLDTYKVTGVDSGIWLHDGQGANVELKDAKVDGEIINCVTCKSDSSTAQTVIYSDVKQDAESINIYRLRNELITNSSTSKTTLNAVAQSYLDKNSKPKLVLTLSAMDVGDTFNHLRLGNTLNIHLANVRFPGGERGWKGTGRIKAMAYNEAVNQVDMTMEAIL